MGKRKIEFDGGSDSRDGKKTKRQWTTTKQDEKLAARRDIEPGDVGLWATCDRGREAKCVAELKDLFHEYTEKLYGAAIGVSSPGGKRFAGNNVEDDVETEIQKELELMRRPEDKPQFSSIRLDTPCLVFFKVTTPIEPVTFAHKIAEDATLRAHSKRTRSVKRLVPISMTGKATEDGLQEVSKYVLTPHFHNGVAPRKFAIRPTIRNHSTLTRDVVIKQVASFVGPDHSVDLKGYDLLILVEIYKNICGMSVVGSDYDILKKYNLAEIFEPTPLPKTKEKSSIEEAGATEGQQL